MQVGFGFSKGTYQGRQSTVEPVFGTLPQFLGLRKVNTRGIKQANKVMLMAATAYNLKKLLKNIKNIAESVSNVQESPFLNLSGTHPA